MNPSAKIAALGRMCGIASEYWDNFGNRHRTSQFTYKALLTSMRVNWEDPARLEEELAARRLRPYDRLLPPVLVAMQSSRRPRILAYHFTPGPEKPSALELQWEITDEAGRSQTWKTGYSPPENLVSRQGPAGWRTRLELPLPARLPLGYYEVRLRISQGRGGETSASRLVVAPETAYLPGWLAAGQRLWGFNLPLYALKSKSNWGIGDFRDLGSMVDWAASLGASFVGVNPLHALPPLIKRVPSPYSPTSRLFRNFLYLDLESVPELSCSPEAQSLLASPEFRRQKARYQWEPLVPYAGVFRLKRRVLEMLYRAFLDRHGPPESPRTTRGEDFAGYLAGAGDSLARFGQYEALAESLEQTDWRRWPQNYQRPDAPAVAEFSRDHLPAIRVHQYGQWLAATQVQEVCTRSRDRGLPFTLYQDLALAAAPGGFDAWANQELFARGAEIGAPPDAFTPRGQSWGIPPLIPERLRESRHQFFLDILRANALPGGMLRFDHVMGLFRLFWIPQSEPPSQGAYVNYPARELLAVLSLESTRRRSLIIGEDLGTVPPVIRRDLARHGVFSYRLLYFERDPEGTFRAPENYPPRAMAAVTTHDLPTLAGFWQGRDLELKRSLNLYPNPQAAEEDAVSREQDRGNLVAAMSRRHLLPPGACSDPAADSCQEDLKVAVMEYLAQSEAALLEVRLEEVFDLPRQQNLPGTKREHPNWNLKIPLTLEEMRRDPRPALLALRLNRYRQRSDSEEGG